MSFDVFIPNKSVLVVSSYRCGSTALCDFLASKYNLLNYGEAFHPQRNIGDFKKGYRSQKFIVKAIPNQIYPEEKEILLEQLLKDCFTIRIMRRDVFDQTLSYFIAKSMDKWHYKSNEEKQDYKVKIDLNLMTWCIDYIKRVNKMVEEFKCNKSLYYEDLGIINCNIQEYHKPTNYLEILEVLRDKIHI